MTLLIPETHLTISPCMGNLLVRMADTSNLETALWKVLGDYISLKTHALRQEIAAFEAKWQMPFTEFAQKFGDGDLSVDAYEYHVESDFWAWEQAETLLEHYEGLAF